MATITAHDPAPVIGHAGHRATPATAQAAWSRMPVAWTAALGCAIAFIVVLRVPDAGIALKVLVDPLLHATSNVNVLLVLGVAAVACASRALQPRLAGISLAQRIHSHVAPIALLAGLALCCTIALWLQLRVLAALALPWDARIRLFDGDANTVSSVLHNHMGKAALSVLTGHALPHASGYDAGHALAGHVPLPAAIALAAAFAVACAGALGCWLQALGRTQDAGHRARIAWLALLAACMLACLKAALDGGLLHYAFAPCLVTLAMALHARTATGFMARRGRWLLTVAASGLGLLSLW
jgi:hypothetical protein